jgi:ketosteroid isomerase-like protein
VLLVSVKTEAGVLNVIDQVAEAFEERDIEKMMSLFSDGDDLVVIGTGADERKVGKSEARSLFKRDWAQSEASSIIYNWRVVSSVGSVAWAAMDGSVYARVGQREIHLPVRLSLVLKKVGNRWQIVHWHVSVPASGQPSGEAWPMSSPIA